MDLERNRRPEIRRRRRVERSSLHGMEPRGRDRPSIETSPTVSAAFGTPRRCRSVALAAIAPASWARGPTSPSVMSSMRRTGRSMPTIGVLSTPGSIPRKTQTSGGRNRCRSPRRTDRSACRSTSCCRRTPRRPINPSYGFRADTRSGSSGSATTSPTHRAHHISASSLAAAARSCFRSIRGRSSDSSGRGRDPPADQMNAYRDMVVQWSKDLGRTIDYLETRSDIDASKVGYYGLSAGARMPRCRSSRSSRDSKPSCWCLGGLIGVRRPA